MPYKGRQRVFWAVAVVAVATAGLLSPSDAHADHSPPVRASQPRTDQFEVAGFGNLDRLNPASKTLRELAIFPWRYVVEPGCEGPAADEVFETLQAAFTELSEKVNIYFIYDPGGWTLRGNCGAAFAAVAGTGPVIGCLCRNFPYNVDIDINIIMADYFRISQIAIWLHELLHALMTWNEQYGLDFRASPGWRDVMNTGSESRHLLEAVELERWARTVYPHPVAGAALVVDQGRAAIFYAATDARATRIAVIIDRGTGPEWAGVYGLPCTVPGIVCGGVDVPLLPQTCYWAKAENSLSWPFALTEILAGCTS